MAHKVLVVDDERPIREILSGLLKREGYEVVTASTGEEALELAMSEGPEVILLDITMPGIDGVETCRRLKAQEKTRSIPVIMISAIGESMMEAVEAGAEDFLNKPFAAVEVFTRVTSILNVRHLRDELDRAVSYIQELERDLD